MIKFSNKLRNINNKEIDKIKTDINLLKDSISDIKHVLIPQICNDLDSLKRNVNKLYKNDQIIRERLEYQYPNHYFDIKLNQDRYNDISGDFMSRVIEIK